MKSIFRSRGPGLAAAAACVALAAVPASAAARSPLATITGDVHAANAALTTLSHTARHHQRAARRALAHNQAAITAAARELRELKGHATAAGAAKALTLIAKQYGADAYTYTALVPKASGSLQTELANAIKPALDGQTIASGLLGELTGLLPSSGASAASGTIGGLLGNLPQLIQSLTGMVDGGSYSQGIQMILSGALTTATGLLDAGINEVKTLLPNLPAPAQAAIQNVLTTIQSAFATFECALNQAVQTISSTLGSSSGSSMMGGQLSSLLSLLQSFFGASSSPTTPASSCPASTDNGSGTPTGTGTSSGTGAPTGAGTATGTGTGMPFLGSLPIPSFVQTMLQNLLGGFGGLLGGSSSGSGLGMFGLGMFGLGGGLPVGLAAHHS
jgi:hypothetical protein